MNETFPSRPFCSHVFPVSILGLDIGSARLKMLFFAHPIFTLIATSPPGALSSMEVRKRRKGRDINEHTMTGAEIIDDIHKKEQKKCIKSAGLMFFTFSP